MKLLPSRRVLCTPYNHAPCHFMQSHMRKVYACLAVTCHLHFWRNDRGLLRATAVTRGWNGYRNKSQHRKLTLEKKILPPLLQGFEPATFRSRVRRSNHRARPTQWLTDFEYKIPVNMPDPIRKAFGYGQLWPAYSRNRAGSYTPDPTSGIRFSSVFPKKVWGILCKTDLDPMWMAWPEFG